MDTIHHLASGGTETGPNIEPSQETEEELELEEDTETETGTGPKTEGGSRIEPGHNVAPTATGNSGPTYVQTPLTSRCNLQHNNSDTKFECVQADLGKV